MFRRAAARVPPGSVCALGAALLCERKLSRSYPTDCAGLSKTKSIHLHVTHVDRRKSIAMLGLQKDVTGKESMQEQVYAWMGWSPQARTPCFDALHENFPGALPGPAIVHRMTRALEQLGVRPDNTVYGQSICPGDQMMKSTKSELSDLMRDYWGECFPLGGLGGPPFVGKTGFHAFSNHVPEGGHVLILFGPHVGITKHGEIGKHVRRGQNGCSTSCSAAISAYEDCCAGKVRSSQPDPHDQQISFLRNALMPRVSQIQRTPEPMAALAVHAYEIVHEQLEVIINNDFGDGNLVLIGGIMLNMPSGMQDHFFPLMFEVRRKGKPTVDLLHIFSCDLTGKDSQCFIQE